MAKKHPKRPHKLPQATDSAKNTSKTFLWTPGGIQTCFLVAQLRQKPLKLLKTVKNHRFSKIKNRFFTLKSGFFQLLGGLKTPQKRSETLLEIFPSFLKVKTSRNPKFRKFRAQPCLCPRVTMNSATVGRQDNLMSRSESSTTN